MQMQHLGTWFTNGLGSDRSKADLNDLKGPFQSKLTHNSITEGICTTLCNYSVFSIYANMCDLCDECLI